MQAIKTVQYLRKMGVTCDINSGDITDYSGYDIIHLFNLTRVGETYKYYKIARYYKRNIVLSPVYWNLKKYFTYENDYESIKLWTRCGIYRKEILKGCRIIYPNSYLEGESIKEEFGASIPYSVIYNGVEVENDDIPLYNFKERYGLDNYVLCVGSICSRKNQRTLAKICCDIGAQLVLIGNIIDKPYFEQCVEYDNVIYMGFMDSYNIYNAYRFARVHALPSFVETPALSSLEAGACGCNVVSTDEGCPKEYFGDLALYCSPYEDASIRGALESALKKYKDDKLKEIILEKYNWEKCISPLYKSYVNILK